MSSRKRRHNRSTFEDMVHPNFEELSRNYPDFGTTLAVVKQQQKERGGSFASNVTQGFTIATTKALLHTYFSLNLPRVPTLCPPVPNRYYFVKWIQTNLVPLMDRKTYFVETTATTTRTHRYGIDLGTGATCIYPLLFCAPHVKLEDHPSSDSTKEWRWLASEVDPSSAEDALQNVRSNGMESKIIVVKVDPTDRQNHDDAMSDGDGQEETWTGPLIRLLEALPAESRPSGYVDVVMTNPPFHDPESEKVTETLREGDQRTRTSMTKQEAGYPGGEANFIIDLVLDSLHLKGGGGNNMQPINALWYASMFGKKTSWNQLKGILTYVLGPARVQATEFGPGHLMRWFLGWTLCKPNVRSPLAIFHKGNNNTQRGRKQSFLIFDATLPDHAGGAMVMREVVDRVVTYFRTLQSYTLNAQVQNQQKNSMTTTRITTREETPHVKEWDVRQLPPAIYRGLQASSFSFMDMLPTEGHFVMDVTVHAKSSNTATVSVKAFVHSQYGGKAVEKIVNPLQAEVCRTTRRWRRLLERQQRQGEQKREEEQQLEAMET